MDVSAALQAAQERLEAIRKRQGITPLPAAERPLLPVANEQPTAIEWGQRALLERRQAEAERQGRMASHTLRMASHEERAEERAAVAPPSVAAVEEPPVEQPAAGYIRTYPSLNTAMIAANLVPAGRVWYLLRHVDRDGRGWLPVADVRQALDQVCTWRNLRKVLARGEGVFWQRDSQDRLFLLGPARAALALGVERLRGRPVLLSESVVRGDLAELRANLFATYHAGRVGEDKPITRAKLERLTGIPGRTQRHYDRLAATRRRRNISIGGKRHTAYQQDVAWEHGRGSFAFVDHHGRQGRRGSVYMAWQLPNSYTSSLAATTKGRQRKHNRSLDLVHKGALGNGETVKRLFYHSGGAAGRAYNRQGGADDAYYLSHIGTRSGAGVWHVLEKKQER